MPRAVRTLKAEGASNVAEEVQVLLSLKKQIDELHASGSHHAQEQVVTPWDVQGAEEDGVQKVKEYAVVEIMLAASWFGLLREKPVYCGRHSDESFLRHSRSGGGLRETHPGFWQHKDNARPH